jgi:acyl carrier protein
MGLDTVELIIAFENEFGLSIPDADAERLTTPRQVTEYVWGRITHERVTKEQVAERVRAVIREQTSIQNFSDDDHFVDDMGLD